jgi:predicted ATPase with chaperone activity
MRARRDACAPNAHGVVASGHRKRAGSEPAKALLRSAIQQLGLSARAYDRLLKVARTITDLGGETDIKPAHVAEAIQYRSLDRRLWGHKHIPAVGPVVQCATEPGGGMECKAQSGTQ